MKSAVTALPEDGRNFWGYVSSFANSWSQPSLKYTVLYSRSSSMGLVRTEPVSPWSRPPVCWSSQAAMARFASWVPMAA